MAERGERRVARVRLPPAWAVHPDAVDETVVHDPSGRPWLVCTSDREQQPALAGAGLPGPPGLPGIGGTGAGAEDEEEAAPAPGLRFETQVFYTARGGIRGFPTGHGQRYGAREEALAGHRRWCLRVRQGEIEPDFAPEDALDAGG
ncbi:MAG TPA: hypothetical protein VH257_24210 [Chloroflexota bacterium]|jgi:hypothetical protein|nr:hypothetical protein [Chloroflexota bacterium]HEX2517830.1 hypothetical protein [Chloroflexota bacterium]